MNTRNASYTFKHGYACTIELLIMIHPSLSSLTQSQQVFILDIYFCILMVFRGRLFCGWMNGWRRDGCDQGYCNGVILETNNLYSVTSRS